MAHEEWARGQSLGTRALGISRLPAAVNDLPKRAAAVGEIKRREAERQRRITGHLRITDIAAAAAWGATAAALISALRIK